MAPSGHADSLRIVFLGTPDFAVASLDALVKNGCTIAGVVTAPDKPAGRGNKLQPSAVKTYALAHNLPLLQPPNLKAPEFLAALRQWNADLQIVVAFRMLPEVVWNMPPMGTFNLHGSLLPQYRGAAPINRAVMNGETETGVTTFLLQHEIDTGNILFQEKIAIAERDTAGIVHDKLMHIGAQLVVKTVHQLAAGTASELPQTAIRENELKSAPKIFKSDCEIDWTADVNTIYNLIRGLSPYPAAMTTVTRDGRNLLLKIFEADREETAHSFAPGTLIQHEKDSLRIACKNGFILPQSVRLEGKKTLPIMEFLRGFDPAQYQIVLPVNPPTP